MPTKRPDKVVHLRLSPATLASLEILEANIQADPLSRALLRVQGSERIPATRLIQFAIGFAASCATTDAPTKQEAA